MNVSGMWCHSHPSFYLHKIINGLLSCVVGWLRFWPKEKMSCLSCKATLVDVTSMHSFGELWIVYAQTYLHTYIFYQKWSDGGEKKGIKEKENKQRLWTIVKFTYKNILSNYCNSFHCLWFPSSNA